MLRRDLLRCRLLAGLIGLGTIGSAQAQAQWPDHPIRFVVPFTPGGGTDAVSRNLADKLARETHWTFVVENKAGAGGNIGLDAVAKSRPDGYTPQSCRRCLSMPLRISAQSRWWPKFPWSSSCLNIRPTGRWPN